MKSVNVKLEPLDLCARCNYLLGTVFEILFNLEKSKDPSADLKKASNYLDKLKSICDDGVTDITVPADFFLYAFIKTDFISDFRHHYIQGGLWEGLTALQNYVEDRIEELK